MQKTIFTNKLLNNILWLIEPFFYREKETVRFLFMRRFIHLLESKK